MPKITKPFVQLSRDPLSAVRDKLKSGEYAWLKTLTFTQDINVRRLINFGCHIGSETLALVETLNFDMAVGVDANLDNLKIAQDAVNEYTPNVAATVAFVGSDIVDGIGSCTGYFDMGYCADVLDKVAICAVGAPESGLHRAIAEMVRVVRPGRLIVSEGAVINKAGQNMSLDAFFLALDMKCLAVPLDGGRVRYE